MHALSDLQNIHIHIELQSRLQGAWELGQEAGRQALVETAPKCQVLQTIQPRDCFARAIQMLSEVSIPEACYASVVLQRLQRSWQATAQLAADTLEAYQTLQRVKVLGISVKQTELGWSSLGR